MYLFFTPLIIAASFTVLFYPLYNKLRKLLKNKNAPSSLFTCLILLLGFLFPLYIIIFLAITQIIELYNSAGPLIRDLFSHGQESQLYRELINSPLFTWLRLNQINWQSILQNSLQRLATIGTYILNRTSTGVFGFVTNIAIAFFTMFYFFIDGEKIIRTIRLLTPIKTSYIDLIFSRFLLISRATIKGTLVIGFIQGTLGAITLLIFGVENWLLLGFIMIIFAIIPLLGAWLILVPAGIIQVILGNLWQGVGIILVSFVVISNIDNIIRPRIVGHGAKMHDLMIFFSTIGGLAIFGVMGFINGPVIASFFFCIGQYLPN
jgi:predicted PurR-regulated permease PerM